MVITNYWSIYFSDLIDRYQADPSCKHELEQDFSERMKKEREEVEDNILLYLLYILYDNKFDELKRDITNLSLLGLTELNSAKRYETLKAILPCILSYYDGDISRLASLIPNNVTYVTRH